MEKLIEYAPHALAVLGALITALAVIAPLTKSDLDNRALAALRKVADLLGRLLGANVVTRVKP
jgi:hypothetical protein